MRIQFKAAPGQLYAEVPRNELVLRIQPNEAIYVKFNNKTPGFSAVPTVSELDITYKGRFPDLKIPDAYEALILDALRGDKSNFVRADELEEAWKIFTPLLHRIELERVVPVPYTYGTRGPAHLAEFVKAQAGYTRTEGYVWTPTTASKI